MVVKKVLAKNSNFQLRTVIRGYPCIYIYVSYVNRKGFKWRYHGIYKHVITIKYMNINAFSDFINDRKAAGPVAVVLEDQA